MDADALMKMNKAADPPARPIVMHVRGETPGNPRGILHGRPTQSV